MKPPKMPWWMKACCWLRYGRDSGMALKIYQRLLDEAYLNWEAEDWRKDLDMHRFNSPNRRRARLGPKDDSWAAHRKLGMSKKRWRILSLPETPAERPDSWDAEKWIDESASFILPVEYASAEFPGEVRTRSGSRENLGFTKFVMFNEELATRSVQETALRMELFPLEFTPECLAAVFFTYWCAAKTYELDENGNSDPIAFTWMIGKDGYARLLELASLSDSMRGSLSSERFAAALRVFVKWYSGPHAVTGMFSPLADSILTYVGGRLAVSACFGLLGIRKLVSAFSLPAACGSGPFNILDGLGAGSYMCRSAYSDITRDVAAILAAS